jgi:hypothetical protein
MEKPLDLINQLSQLLKNTLSGKDVLLADLRIIDAHVMLAILELTVHDDRTCFDIYNNMDGHMIEFFPSEIVQYLEWWYIQPIKKSCKTKKPRKKS